MPSLSPHKLDLYRLSVQRPAAQVNLLSNMYAFHRPGRWATHLREDFSGSAALAAAWVRHDPDHAALAVERHGPTLGWSRRRWSALLGRDAPRLRFIHSDAMAVARPHTDITVALNYSILIYHDHDRLLAYLRHTRKALAPGGILVVDLFGGPGAQRTDRWSRCVIPEASETVPPFTQLWEQRSYDALTARIDCRIHFRLPRRRTLRDAFVYDWRLWTIPELRLAMRAAGFASTGVWCDAYNPRTGQSDGDFRPVDSIPPREDFVAYVVALK